MASLARFNGVAWSISGSSPVIAPLASVEVKREDTGALASIFSDRDGLVGISNPTTADAFGRFSFHAAGLALGYRIRVTEAGSPGLEYTLRYVGIGTLSELDNPITTKGDLIVGGTSGVMSRKAAGPDGSVLVSNASESDGLEWLQPQQGSPVGDADGFVLTAQSSADEGLAFVPPPMGFNLVGGYLDWSTVGSPTSTLSVAIKTWDGSDPSAQKPVFIAFRSATAGNGSLVYRKITAATSITINSSALLGTSSGIAFRLWCAAFDDGGTIRLALINCLSGTSVYPLSGFGIASATQEGDTADSAHVFYSDGAAVSSKPYAVLGYGTWESGLPNAGNWNSDPTREQLFGPGVPLPGSVVQLARSQDGASASGATALPWDDTIPQNTEGTQFMTVTLTPTSAANVLRWRHVGTYALALASATACAALFQDSVASALAAVHFPGGPGGSGQGSQAVLEHSMVAGTTSATTGKIRAGDSAGSTITFNGSAAARKFGGVCTSTFSCEEIVA